MPANAHEIHPGWNDDEFRCNDCGATWTQVDDNLAKVCEPIHGPHRLALIEIRHVIREAEAIAWCAHLRAKGMNDRKHLLATIEYARMFEDQATALKASFDALSALNGEPAPRVRQDAALVEVLRK